MTNKTPPYRLRSNANYHNKTVQKPLRFKRVEDADLLAAIANDKTALNKLVISLLRTHYNLPNENEIKSIEVAK